MPLPSGVPAEFSLPADVACDYFEHKARVTFNGPVTVPAMQLLVRHIERAFDYYQYENVEIEIDSPGGELRALKYFLEYRRAWQRRGYGIHTSGVVACASAAALLLAFGDHGHRRIRRSTELLFHFPRIEVESCTITAVQANRLAIALRQADDDMLDSLIGHIAGQPGTSGSGAWQAYFEKTARRHALVSAMPEEAAALHGPYAFACSGLLAEIGTVIGTPDSIDGLPDRLRARLRKCFETELLMNHAEAYILNLVDHVNDLTPGCDAAS